MGNLLASNKIVSGKLFHNKKTFQAFGPIEASEFQFA